MTQFTEKSLHYRGEPRGILGSGWVTSDVYEDEHWDKRRKAGGKTARYVNGDWDTLLDPEISIFPHDVLVGDVYAKMHWEPQASGTRIPDNVADQLESDWGKFLNRPVVLPEMSLAEEVDTSKTYIEGATRQVIVNVYERNPEARTICINHYGPSCSVCGFNFDKTYSKIGAGYIHVHHLISLAQIGKAYKLNPLKDLRPVCPNCHAMLHKKNPAYTIDELRVILKRATR